MSQVQHTGSVTIALKAKCRCVEDTAPFTNLDSLVCSFLLDNRQHNEKFPKVSIKSLCYEINQTIY